jgi:hypothetical protein
VDGQEGEVVGGGSHGVSNIDVGRQCYSTRTSRLLRTVLPCSRRQPCLQGITARPADPSD